MREKEKLSWELTNLWYIILSETSNYEFSAGKPTIEIVGFPAENS